MLPSKEKIGLRPLWSTILALGAALLAGQCHSADLLGDWVFTPSSTFPEFTALTLKGAKPLQGTIRSRWYGELPLQGLHRDGGALVFHLDNGNPRLKPDDLRIAPEGEGIRLSGNFWYAKLDVAAHRAAKGEMDALAFKTYPTPPLKDLPDNGLVRTPPMGWNSWNHFAENIDEATVRQIADAMVRSGLKDSGYVYINLDDGWQGTRDAKGVLLPNSKFPDMKRLADDLHAMGLKLGLYSSPGPRSCAGFPGSYGHVEQDARTYADWGIDYLKYDLCSGEAFYRSYESVRAAYQAMGEALQATRRPVVFSLCEYGRFDVGAWGRKVGGNLWRTTGDITDNYAAMAVIGFDKTAPADNAGPGGWNDPDMLEVGNGGMNLTEYRSHFSLWALLAAPLLLGNDLRSIQPEILNLLTNRDVVAVDQDALGRQGRRAVQLGDLEIWIKPLADGTSALGIFNRSAIRVPVALSLSELGLGASPKLRDLWQQVDLASGGSQFRANVEPHSVILLKVWSR